MKASQVPMRRHLAVFLPSLGGGGAERVMVTLANGFVERGVDVDLVLSNGNGKYLDQVSDGVALWDLNCSRVAASVPGLVRYLKKRQPCIVMSALERANFAALTAAKLSGINLRTVVTVHNTLTKTVGRGSSLREKLIPSLLRRMYPMADRIVAVSKGAAEDLSVLARLDRARIAVIYNPVLFRGLRRRSQEPVEHPWFNGGEVPVILAIGRLTLQKNFPLLLEAFAKIRRHRKIRLVILGEGEDRNKLEAQARQIGVSSDLWMPGFVENPYKYMSRASVFALSSAWEGLPTVLIEVLACGTPVVATDCPSGPREILDNGRWGRLVPPHDVNALEKGLVASLGGLTPGKDCSVHLKQFSMEYATEKYIRLMDGLWDQGGDSRN